LTDASVVSRIEALSPAEKPRTSRRTSAVRWSGGSRCRPATNASETASFVS
jgi:hypothetical protein